MFESSGILDQLHQVVERVRVEGASTALTELVQVIGACQEVVAAAQGLQVLAMAHVAAVEDVGLEDGTVVEQWRGLGHQRLDAPALVCDVLGLSDFVASSRMGLAVDLVTRHPRVVSTMTDGCLDLPRAAVVSDELRDAPPEVCEQVDAVLADSLGREGTGSLRRRVRRALERVDAQLLRDKVTRARAARSLRRCPGAEPGVDQWWASFPAEQSRSAWSVVDGVARRYVAQGRNETLEQARADALMDLVHARATGTVEVQVAVSAEQLLQHAAPADPTSADRDLVVVRLTGHRDPVHVSRSWLAELTGGGASGGADGVGHGARARPGTGVTVVACDGATGALLSTPVTSVDPSLRAPGAGQGTGSRRGAGRLSSTAHDAPRALARLVRGRDGWCRFPGCAVPAASCDLDHVVAWPAGPTDATNLICLCRRHHRVKQRARWSVRLHLDGTLTWTDPLGRRRVTDPVDHLGVTDLPPMPSSPASPPTAPRSSALPPTAYRASPAPRTTLASVLPTALEDEMQHLALARFVQRQRSLMVVDDRGSQDPVLTPRPVADVLAPTGATGALWYDGRPPPGHGCRGRRRRTPRRDDPPPF